MDPRSIPRPSPLNAWPHPAGRTRTHPVQKECSKILFNAHTVVSTCVAFVVGLKSVGLPS